MVVGRPCARIARRPAITCLIVAAVLLSRSQQATAISDGEDEAEQLGADLPWNEEEAAPHSWPVTVNDLLVVIPTYELHIALGGASRQWRRGAKAHMTVDPYCDIRGLATQGEIFGESISATPNFPGTPRVLRQVFAPVMAHNTALNGRRGSKKGRMRYKWMLVADDDTIWNVPAVLRLLNDLDLPPDLPWALSDMLNHCHWVPEANGTLVKRTKHLLRVDDTCLPCDPDSTKGYSIKGGRCPCRLDLSKRSRPPCETSGGGMSFYGGAGVILSYGLMEMLADNLTAFYQVAFEGFSGFSDLILSEAIRRVTGIGITYPGPLPVDESTLPETRIFGGLDRQNDIIPAEDTLQRYQRQLRTDPDLLKRTVSVHLRHMGDLDGMPRYFDVYRQVVDLIIAEG